MKVWFETLLISYICMFFLSIGLYFMDVLFTHQEALQLQEYAVMMIEHHNRYDTMVARAIDEKAEENGFVVNVESEGDTYSVEVKYAIHSGFLGLNLGNTLYTICASR